MELNKRMISFAILYLVALGAMVYGQDSTTPAPVDTTTSGDNCTDSSDCTFTHYTCTGPYHAWATTHCPAYCGFCTPVNFVCEDIDANCAGYGPTLCNATSYAKFAYTKCMKFCGFCPGDRTTPAPKTGCYDEYEACATDSTIEGKIACEKYPEWSNIYCQKYCGFCQSNETSASVTVTTPTTPPTTTHDPDCFDLKGQECEGSGAATNATCCGPYLAYSEVNCRAHCKFCTPKHRVCTDTIPNCNQFQTDLCTNSNYWGFVEKNCAGYCDYCTHPRYIPDCAYAFYNITTTETPPTSSTLGPVCTRDGQVYRKGEIWDTEDCRQSCECQDPDTNQINCQPLKCPTWKPHCEVNYVPGACCPTLTCNYFNHIHGERTQDELKDLLG